MRGFGGSSAWMEPWDSMKEEIIREMNFYFLDCEEDFGALHFYFFFGLGTKNVLVWEFPNLGGSLVVKNKILRSQKVNGKV